MKQKINIATIGTGFMGRTHAYGAAAMPFFYESLPFRPVLHTICSRSAERGGLFCEEFGYLRHESDFAAVLADPEVDVIDICTPNFAHYETLLAALAAGRHIYCEKPLTVTAAESGAVLAAYEALAAKPVCAVVFHNRFFPAVLRMKELIGEGRIGNIVTFSCRYLHSSDMDINRPAGWKQTDGFGGGTLHDLGSHAIDLVRFMCGEFSAVSGTPQIYFKTRRGMDGADWQTDADEAFYITARLACGAVGTVEASKLAHGANDDLTLEVRGERGALIFDLMQPNYLRFYDACAPGEPIGGTRGFTDIECVQRYPKPAGIFPGVKAPVGWLRAHMHSLYTFLGGVYGGTQPSLSPSLADGAAVQRVMEAARQSGADGGRYRHV